MMAINEFITMLEINHINLFKLCRFLQDSHLANKLQGFTDARRKQLAEETKNTNQSEFYVSKHTSPLRPIEDFINALSTPDDDGRIIVSSESAGINVKYLLLNPANCFKPVAEQARSVIFAGGTMSPMSDFVQQV